MTWMHTSYKLFNIQMSHTQVTDQSQGQEAPRVSFCGCSNPLSHIVQASNHHTLLGHLLMTCNQSISFLLLPSPYLMGDFLSNFPAVLWNPSSAIFIARLSGDEACTSATLDKSHFRDKNSRAWSHMFAVIEMVSLVSFFFNVMLTSHLRQRGK